METTPPISVMNWRRTVLHFVFTLLLSIIYRPYSSTQQCLG